MTRALIEAQRAGYIAGAQAAAGSRWTAKKQLQAIEQAQVAFPMTEERPRTVVVPSLHGPQWNVEYKVEGGRLFSRMPNGRNSPHPRYDPKAWKPSPQSKESLAALLDLFARPTETVEVTE